MSTDANKEAVAAYAAIFFIGGLNVVLGLVAIMFDIEILTRMGVGIWSLLEGALYIFLGFLVKGGSVRALWVAIALFALDSVFFLQISLKVGGTPPIGAII